MQHRQPYPTDLSAAEWYILEPLVPAAQLGGRPTAYPKREIVNAIFYALRSGCAWRLVPNDLLPWGIVYHYFWQWRRGGTWQRMNSGGDTSFDSAKQIKGRMRHTLVNTLGLLIEVVVTAANVQGGGLWSGPSPGSESTGG